MSESRPEAPSPVPLSQAKPLRLALVGSANSGKTTLFNTLTGSHYATVNYPGATVEYTVGLAKRLKNLQGLQNRPCEVMDTPGLASLIPASPDEEVTVEALFSEATRPDLVLAVADSTQLSRHLYLIHQLREMGFPTVVAVTMGDLLKQRGAVLDGRKLEEIIDCPVIQIDPRRAEGLPELALALEKALAKNTAAPSPILKPENLAEWKIRQDDASIALLYQNLDLTEKLCISPMAAGPGQTGSRAKIRAVKPSETMEPSPAWDKFLLHPVLGLLFFIFVMCCIFTAIFWMAGPFMDAIDTGFGWLIEASKSILPASWATDLFADGLLGGVGAVLVFLPQIIILFLAMGYLEDSGYLARGAALVDRPLSAIGLNGKSFVPLLSGYACAIPAMLSARTITSRFERNLTLFIIPLMSCSARLPVYTLLISFLVPGDKPWLGGMALTGLYLLGFVMAAAVSTVISKIAHRRNDGQFLLELPALRAPVLRVVLASTWYKTYQYLRKAGLTIVVIALGLWVLTHTPIVAPISSGNGGNGENVGAETPGTMPDEGSPAASHEYVAVTNSYAATLGHFLEPVMRPMGLDWRGGVALISGFAAREVFVSALALVYRVQDGGDEEGLTGKLLTALPDLVFEDTGKPIFTLSTCLGMLLFYLIALQCFPTVAVARNELGSGKLALIQLVLFTGVAYVLAVGLVQGLRSLGFP